MQNKVLILGIDGMDPKFTNKLVKEGKLPNIQKYIENGSARADLAMLGGMPTITPPMWTTLATGATPATHGITCFWNQDNSKLDHLVYNLYSTDCKAEQLWNVTAEAGIKTLVFHWPGSSWPPSSDSPNLHVVDGTSPGSVQCTVALVDMGSVIYAGEEVDKLVYLPFVANDCGAGCIIYNIPDIEQQGIDYAHKIANVTGGNQFVKNIIMSHEDGEMATERVPNNAINSPLKPAEGWANAPEDAKEFTIYEGYGLLRRPCLLLKNADGKYDTVAVYSSKKSEEPLYSVSVADGSKEILETLPKGEGTCRVNRYCQLINVAEDGSSLTMVLEGAMDIDNDTMWSPKSIYHDVVEHCGYIPTPGMNNGLNAEYIKKLTLPGWRRYNTWQANAIQYLIKEHDYGMVFSHLHNIDTFGHAFWHQSVARANQEGVDSESLAQCMEQAYIDTDEYLGSFSYLIDEGWTIIITSDHGLLCSYEDMPPLLGDPFGVNVRVMQELGYTILKRDENGQEIAEIDWGQTRAVASRGNHICINLRGRNEQGIVEPEDKYELERQIIDDLYNYRDPATHKRVVSLALRNKDSAILGMNGEESGDIIYILEEGFNRVHGDSLPTFEGFLDTSVSPIFIATGPGVKKHCTTDRVIREMDVAPTVAAILGVRMPAQCEGAPVYQILAES